MAVQIQAVWKLENSSVNLINKGHKEILTHFFSLFYY